MFQALSEHWPEYLIEAWALGTFMILAATFVALLEHPGSPLRKAITSGFLRRATIGMAMGITAIALIYSPWGQRSGAHMNPATTVTFFMLGKVEPWDAVFYIFAQFIGGVSGMLMAKCLFGSIISHPAVNHVVTVPGKSGVSAAFFGEFCIAAIMMLMVLLTTNDSRLAAYTGVAAGLLVFLYITFEAPLSGMSMNPARTAASALPSRIWTHSWIYFAAPILGMLLGARMFLATQHQSTLACPKLYHGTTERCIFCGQSDATVSRP